MKTVIGILIGMVLILAFQKIMNDGKAPETVSPTEEMEVDAEIPQDFIHFYTKFHSDSLYQIDHTNFPLEGLPPNADSLTFVNENYFWQKDNWRMHRLPDESGDIQKNWVKLSDALIVENIELIEAKRSMQRRFAKTSKGWTLIYYAAPN